MDASTDHLVTSVEQLRTLYREPSAGAANKETDHIDDITAAFIASSPFCLISTADADGNADVSPKGGDPGFIKVLDDGRLAVPDLNGNNRLDSLRNLMTNAGIGLLFLVPKEGATLRIKGRATVTTDPEILAGFQEYRTPTTAIVVEVETAFMHCAKCIRRSGLWDPESWGEAAAPTGTDLIMSHMKLDPAIRDQVDAGLEQSYVDGLDADRP